MSKELEALEALWELQEVRGWNDEEYYKRLDLYKPIEMVDKVSNNTVNHPNHYNNGMECIDEMILVFGMRGKEELEVNENQIEEELQEVKIRKQNERKMRNLIEEVTELCCSEFVFDSLFSFFK